MVDVMNVLLLIHLEKNVNLIVQDFVRRQLHSLYVQEMMVFAHSDVLLEIFQMGNAQYVLQDSTLRMKAAQKLVQVIVKIFVMQLMDFVLNALGDILEINAMKNVMNYVMNLAKKKVGNALIV